ncbi:hypothetical protein GCM10011529_10470 [Polymorphobacter glacialis]|uniref:DUF4384 domain-containing protein n=1 Tax=Sandarakinorhabdus glacialis TaxID=1614636 RepID=A0A916ZND0_9SPHN|nr:hypothetical protein [Polymorphobacter glacialis]GGE05996.1 hypothetical protein GCM10011529_10470 [Polymorphobacter glacialis]
MMRDMLRAAAIAAALSATVPAAAQLSVNKRADLAAPVVLGPNQGAIVVGFRRPDDWSAGKSGTIAFARYDVEKRDMIARPDNAKKLGDTNTYWVSVTSGDRKLVLDHVVMLVSPGDYVLYGATPGPGGMVANSFCFSAPTIRVAPGEIVYFGDVTPYLAARVAGGGLHNGMAYSAHPEDARAALANQPALAAAFKSGDVRNGASYTCSGQAMMAYIVPGKPSLPDLAPDQKLGNSPTTPPREAGPRPTVPILIPTGN